MGEFTSLMEGAMQGVSLGLSDLLGVTGKGGLIHDGEADPERQAIIVSNSGIYFNECKERITWKNVKEIVKEEDGLYRFELRGGLIFYTGWIHWSDAIASMWMEGGKCDDHKNKTLFELDLDDFKSPDNRKSLTTALLDVLWAAGIADQIRDSEHIVLNEYLLLWDYYIAFLLLRDVESEVRIDDEENIGREELGFKKALKGAFKKVFESYNDFVTILEKQLEHVDADEEDVQKLVASIFACPNVSGKGIDNQAKCYDSLRNAKAYGEVLDDNRIPELLANNSGGDTINDTWAPLGADDWAKRRKMIVCTDERADLTTWRDGLQIPNTLVMDAQDIIDYNNAVSADLKLIFGKDEPQNGMMYIQHPMKQNVYFSIKTFNSGLLEQKYNELKKLLVALGATQVTCEVEYSDTTDEKYRRRMKAGGGVDTVFGGVEGSFANDNASSRVVSLRNTLAHRIVKRSSGKPYIPEGMVFYPFEESWQDLASMALDGSLKEYDVSLTCSKDYAVTGHSLYSVGAKIKSKVPGYQFGVEGNFEKELDSELKQLQSTVWHYHAVFG